MKKPREDQDKNLIGALPEQPLPVSQTPEVQNIQPLIPQNKKPQLRQNKSRVRLRK